MYKKAEADNPTFAAGPWFMLVPYLGEHKYQQVIQEYQAYAQRSGDKNMAEFAAALDSASAPADGPAPRTRGSKFYSPNAKPRPTTSLRTKSRRCMPTPATRTTPSSGSTPPTRNAASWSSACGLTPRLIPCAPIRAMRSWCGRSGSRNRAGGRGVLIVTHVTKKFISRPFRIKDLEKNSRQIFGFK